MTAEISSLINTATRLLQDPSIEMKEGNSDRVSASTTANAGSVTQAAVAPGAPVKPEFSSLDTKASMQYSQNTSVTNIRKMVKLSATSWELSNGYGSLLHSIDLPKAFWSDAKMPAFGNTRYFEYMRGSMHFQIQVNAEQGACGALLAVYIPDAVWTTSGNGSKFSFETLMNQPHVIMNIATCTQADLFIPYMSTHNYVPLRTDWLGKLCIYILSELNVATGASTNALDVVTFGSFIDLDLQGPIPYKQSNQAPGASLKSKSSKFKWTRQKVDIAEGPGSMNLANYLNTAGAQSVALVGERAYYDRRTAGTKSRVQDFRGVVRTPCILTDLSSRTVSIGKFDWPASKATGEVVYQSNITIAQMSNLGFLSHFFQYWRGSIVFRIQIFASSFHRGRLRVAINPSNNTDFDDRASDNLLYQVCDIGLDSTFEITLPFTCRNWMRETRDGYTIRLKIFVLSRLAHNASAPNMVRGLIYVSGGKDFQFLVPTSDTTTWQISSWGSEMDLNDPLDDSDGNPASIQSSNVEYGQDEGMAEAVGLASAENDGTLDDIHKSNDPVFLNYKLLKADIYAVDHMKLDNFFGRAWYHSTIELTENTTTWIAISAPNHGHGAAMRAYAFWAGEVNFHIVNNTDKNLQFGHTYPKHDEENADLASKGCVLVPPHESMSISAPFYSQTPLRDVFATEAFGNVFLRPEATGQAILYVSLRAPNFFQQRVLPIKATSRSLLDSGDLPDLYNLVRAIKEVESEEPFNLRWETSSRFGPKGATLLNAYKSGASNFSLLKLAGDIEENPGPVSLVYKDRGIYKHYGVTDGCNVYHINTENILQSILDGTAVMVSEWYNPAIWHTEQTCDLDFFVKNNIQKALGSRYKFSVSQNCETVANDIFGCRKVTQGEALQAFAFILVAASSSCLLFGSLADIQLLVDQDGDEPGLQAVVQKAMSWFSSAFTQTLESDLVRFLCLGVIRLVCYLIMYCHAPNLLTTLSLGTLIFMDIKACDVISSDTASLLKTLVEGDVHGLITNIAERLQDVGDKDHGTTMKAETVAFAREITKTENQNPFDDFNKISLSARHIDWWIKTFTSILEYLRKIFKPTTAEQFADWLSTNKEVITNLLTTVNEHLKDCRDHKKIRDPKFQEKHRWISSKVFSFQSALVKYAISTPLAAHVNRMAVALNAIVLPPTSATSTARLEPLGIAIMGEPGQGKSFLVNHIVKTLVKENNWDRVEDVFPHPVGSAYYDGYNGQKIHLIDDLGQHVEENDVSLLCQAISSVPFCVPMAAVEQKGQMYTSEIVIATTNKCDFHSRVLTDPGALSRRFPVNVRIRAKKQFCKDGKLDAATHMDFIITGNVWEVSKDGYNWQDFDLKTFTTTLVEIHKKKVNSFKAWNTFMNEGIEDELDFQEWATGFLTGLNSKADAVFDWLEVQVCPNLTPAKSEIKVWFDKIVSNMKAWVSKNRNWIFLFSCISSALGILTSIYLIVRKDRPAAQNPYKGAPIPRKSNQRFKIGDTKDLTFNEAPVFGEIAHLQERAAYIRASNTQNIYHVLPYSRTSFLAYGHISHVLNRLEDPVLVYKNREIPIDDAEVTPITVNQVGMDLILVKIKNCPIQFRDVSKLISKKLGRENYLLWSSDKGLLLVPVKNAHFSGTNTTYEGTTCYRTITYEVSTARGMCGGLLVSKVDGAFKIIGMHIAGNGCIGKSAQLGPLLDMHDEGLIVAKAPAPFLVHQPTCSKLKQSPLHGVWPVEMEPAALSQNDPRVEIQTNSLIKTCSEKYRVNHFQPDPEVFKQVFMRLKQVFQEKLGVNPMWTIEQALLDPSEHPLDLSTSPGHKFTQLGFRKKDLVNRENQFIHPVLRGGVEELQQNLVSSEVYFYSHLKDELRSIEKIKLGKTRCIEASDFDYVVFHRMIFGPLYEKIYATHPLTLGMAVGIDPWRDWDSMINGLMPYNMDFDFSKFDGSLSHQLMAAASKILCSCLEKPELGEAFLQKTIFSKHVVLDEMWTVSGGMPSGSPCTTVLNSLCNLLASGCCAMEATPGQFQLVVYGDDLILSADRAVDGERFQEVAKNWFGMEVTPGDKDSGEFVIKSPDKVQFLKRETVLFPGSNYKVGALMVDNLKQHLMWCKDVETFKDQLNTALIELSVRGKEVYDLFLADISHILSNFNIWPMDWECAIYEASQIVFF
nr:MAG: polyprotein [Jingmen bat picornavirus 5]